MDIELEENMLQKDVLLTPESPSSDAAAASRWRRRLTIGVLMLAASSSSMSYSCIAPFFPSVARSKGASGVHIGAIFGVYQLVQLVCSPLIGKHVTQLGCKRLFSFGLITLGISEIAFSFLLHAPSGWPFILLAFVARIFEAIGNAAFVTTNLTIATMQFPDSVSTVVGILELSYGLGFIIGPPVGGVLYQVIGYAGPFVILGTIPVILGCISLLIPKPEEPEKTALNSESIGIFGLLRIPGVVIVLLCSVAALLAFGFIEPTLQDHLENFDLTPLMIGVMFLVPAATYTAAAIIIGRIADKTHFNVSVIITTVGAFLGAIAMLLLGPSPILQLPKFLWLVIVALALMGAAISAMFIPTFALTLAMATQRGHPTNLATSGCISGLFNSALAVGGFVGPTFGAVAVEIVGFPWTSTAIAVVFFALVLLLPLVSLLHSRNAVRLRDKCDEEECCRF